MEKDPSFQSVETSLIGWRVSLHLLEQVSPSVSYFKRNSRNDKQARGGGSLIARTEYFKKQSTHQLPVDTIFPVLT